MKKVLLGLVLASAVVMGGCASCAPDPIIEPCNKCVQDSLQICSECDDYMLPIPNVTEL